MTAHAALEGPISAAFAGLSRIRRARAFHPRGAAYDADIDIVDGNHPMAQLAGSYRGVVRVSRGIGLPEPAPDILGVAIRLFDAGGPGVDQDFLLATTGDGFPARHVLLPARRPAHRTFSSLLRYGSGGRRWTVGARLAPGDERAYELLVAEGRGPWAVVGRVELGATRPHDEGQALRFSPWNTVTSVQPIGWLNALRRQVYAASQAARPDTAAEQDEPVPGGPPLGTSDHDAPVRV